MERKKVEEKNSIICRTSFRILYKGKFPIPRSYYSLDLKIRGACVSMVAVPARDTICAKECPLVAGVLGTVMGFCIVLRNVRVMVISDSSINLKTFKHD
jgi:hypothetical protein